MNVIEKTPFGYKPHTNGNTAQPIFPHASPSHEKARQNPRFDIANRSLRQIFLKWLAIPNIEHQIDKFIEDFNKPEDQWPIYHNPFLNSSSFQNSLLRQEGTPPIQGSPHHKHGMGGRTSGREPFTSPSSTRRPNPNRSTVLEGTFRQDSPMQIPQFFFPKGKPMSEQSLARDKRQIEKAFGAKGQLQVKQFEPVLSQVCECPKYFSETLFQKIDKDKTGKISKIQFSEYYKKHLQKHQINRRLFTLIASEGADYIVPQNFQAFMKSKKLLNLGLLEKHPGLEFLRAFNEFQDRYMETVILRIFFTVDINDDGRISFRQFKKSNLKQVLFQVCEEEDINRIRDYFSYEHFYVLYIRFWELDSDHDFLISKQDFGKYEGHALSRKVVNRIFQQVPRKFQNPKDDKMSYKDFLWFMLCQEDKTTKRSLDYWFEVVNLAGNGIITPYEMEYFYEEQVQRLQFNNHEPILFVDILCQMTDMLKPPKPGHFSKDLFKNGKHASIFFNTLLNLVKFISHEGRDLFQLKNLATEFPDWTQWDIFAKNEYDRLANEEEINQDVSLFDTQSEVMDTMEQEFSDQDDYNDSMSSMSTSTATSSSSPGGAMAGAGSFAMERAR